MELPRGDHPAPIRVISVDDNAPLRASLRAIFALEDDFELVGEAGDGSEGVALAESLRPDAVLLDIQMPGMNGIDAGRLIKQRLPGVKIIYFVAEMIWRDQALAAGADAFLLKETPIHTVLDAIRAAVRPPAPPPVPAPTTPAPTTPAPTTPAPASAVPGAATTALTPPSPQTPPPSRGPSPTPRPRRSRSVARPARRGRAAAPPPLSALAQDVRAAALALERVASRLAAWLDASTAPSPPPAAPPAAPPPRVERGKLVLPLIEPRPQARSPRPAADEPPTLQPSSSPTQAAPTAAATQPAPPETRTVRISAFPIATFSMLTTLLHAVEAIPGVHEVRADRFRDRRLEATVIYAGADPLERHLAALDQFQLTVRRGDDGRLEISLDA